MQQALQLAERGLFTTSPNPRVGCVLVRDDRVVGEGWHARAGSAHAEIHALNAAGEAARGATAYVTLEPCNHHGRTPPCTEALIQAGVTRVVAAMRDPNPQACGGAQRLQAAGVDVSFGVLESAARELNLGFISRVTRGRPWVRMKIAASLDGRTALANGVSQWITGAAARADGHAWRARACAVLTGIGTVREDNPQLNVRDISTPRQPMRVVIDSRLETPPEARILHRSSATQEVLIVAANEQPDAHARLVQAGAQIAYVPNAAGKVDLPAMLALLADRGINELHVEAGEKLNGSLLREGCVDELLLYLAPTLLGDTARAMACLPTYRQLPAPTQWRFHAIDRVGDDVRLLARVFKES